MARLATRQSHQAAVSPDGRFLAVDDQDDVVVWETAIWSETARLKGHLSTILTIQFSPDGRWLASAGRDREVRLWAVADWQAVHRMSGHRGDIEKLSFTPESRSLLALDLSGYLKVWDVTTGLDLGCLRTPADGHARQFAVTPDLRTLAVRNDDGHVILCRLRGD